MRKIAQNPPIRDSFGTGVPVAGPTIARACAFAITIVSTATIVIGLTLPTQADPSGPEVSFSKQVYPIFENYRCLTCHSPAGIGEIASGLDLSTYKGLRQGSAQGVAIVPRFADRSPMMRLLNNNWDSGNPESLKMPPMGPRLSAQDLKIVSDWINQGAKDN